MKKIDATTFLQSVVYDAQKMLHDRHAEQAYNFLIKKLHELDKYEKADYMKVDWE